MKKKKKKLEAAEPTPHAGSLTKFVNKFEPSREFLLPEAE